MKYGETKLKCTNITQTVYSLTDIAKNSRVFNISSVIKQGDTDSLNQHSLLSDKLKAMGSNVHINFGTNMNNAIANLGNELLRTDVTNLIIYFGAMTPEEKEERQKQESASGNIIPIIELGDTREVYSILEKLSGYVDIKTEEITVTSDNDYAYGENIKVGSNVVLNAKVEEDTTQPEQPPEQPSEQPPNLGNGDKNVTIVGRIEKDSNIVTELDKKVQLTIKQSSDNTIVVGPIKLNITDAGFNTTAKLNKDIEYYIEYEFLPEAFNMGYSTQEYFIDKIGIDNKVPKQEIKTVNADDNYLEPSSLSRRNSIIQAYKEIDASKETELDTYGNNTKLIARTSTFTIDEWQEPVPDGITGIPRLEYRYTKQIQSSFKLTKREEIQIELGKKISGIKIVLQDGSEFLKEEEGKNLSFAGTSGSQFKIIHMDDEIMHGATVYVEYTIKATASDAMKFESVTIRDLLDDSENNGGKVRNIYYDENCELITEPGKTNADYNWQIPTSENDGKQVIGTIDTTNTELKIVTSQVITQDCEAAYRNTIFIESYKTITGKRNGSFGNYRRAGNKNQTKALSEEVKILPPFGKN